MDDSRLHDIDAQIESTLAGEPMRAVPQGFHERVIEQVRLEAVTQSERKRSRLRLIMGAIVGVALVGAFAVVPFIAIVSSWTSQKLPGGLGLFDLAGMALALCVSLVKAIGTPYVVLFVVTFLVLSAGVILGIRWQRARHRM